MKTLRFCLVLTSFILLVGCASTSISYVRNPEVKQIANGKIMIYAPFQDIGLRKSMETAFVDEYTKNGKQALASIELIPPVREYSAAEFAQIIVDNEIKSIVKIEIIDAYLEQTYVPQTSVTTGNAQVYGNTVYGQSHTTVSGGYTVSKPRVKFEVSIYQTNDAAIVWKATALSAGNAFAQKDTLYRSLAAKIVKEYCLLNNLQ